MKVKHRTKFNLHPLLNFQNILVFIFLITCFTFFCFFYQYHLFFIEQTHLFRLSWDYILNYFQKPAILACLTGDFLTQFYYLRFGGAIILTASFFLLYYLLSRSIYKIFSWKFSSYLALLFAIVVITFHFNLVYPLSATISLIIATTMFLLYASFATNPKRSFIGVVLIPFLYVFAGFAVFLYALLVLLYLLKINDTKNWRKWIYSLSILVFVCLFPLCMRSSYILSTKQAYAYPVTEFKKPIPKFVLERLFTLDSEWYFNHSEKVIEYARKISSENRYTYVAYYYNLASATINKMPENLLQIEQKGIKGMYIPITEKTNFISLIIGNELYYFIGDINEAEHYALRANTYTPGGQSSRMIKRLAEVNIIKGEYAVAEKYLKILSQTLFHRKWAQNMTQYLNEDLCQKTPWILKKRTQMPITDCIKANQNDIVGALYSILDDHPANQAALNHLLCICLLNKNIDGFYSVLTKYKYHYSDTFLPRLYQEALFIYFDLHRNDSNVKKFSFSKDVIKDIKQYQKVFKQTHKNKNELEKRFGNTYWYYFNFN